MPTFSDRPATAGRASAVLTYKDWRPELMEGLKKEGTHKALDEIRESIKELQYYREHSIKTKRA
jgi:oligoribonuclease (3'-5' exoribonuclease)